MVLKNQPQRRLGPYWDITGRRRRRFKTNAAWARTGALRADGEGGSKPTTLGPVRRHYGQTESGGITGRRRGRSKTKDAWPRTEALRADGEGHYGQTTRGIDILIFLSCIPHTLLYLRNLFSWVIIVGTAKIPKIENRRVLGSAVLRFF